jgi:hypothetical protein
VDRGRRGHCLEGAVRKTTQITPGEWRVGQNLAGDEGVEANGRVVMAGLHIVADCRNDALAMTEQRGNARLTAAAGRMLDMLRELELALGDRPAVDKESVRLHSRIVNLLTAEGLL